MAAELYKPFIIRKLIERGIVKTVKSAKKIIDRREPLVWDILENVLKGKFKSSDQYHQSLLLNLLIQ